MNKIELLQHIELLNHTWNISEAEEMFACVEQMEILLEQYLQEHPDDTDILKRLAMTLHMTPLVDDVKAVECLKKVMSIDKNDVYALAALLELEWLICGIMDPQDCLKLYDVTTDDPEMMSIVEYMKAQYIKQEKGDIFEYIACLEKSVALWPKHVNNLLSLGRLWYSNGRKQEAKELMRRAYSNIQNVFQLDQKLDMTSIERFIEQFITGTRTNQVMLSFLDDELEKKS